MVVTSRSQPKPEEAKWDDGQRARYKPRRRDMSADVGPSSGIVKSNLEYNLREGIRSSACGGVRGH